MNFMSFWLPTEDSQHVSTIASWDNRGAEGYEYNNCVWVQLCPYLIVCGNNLVWTLSNGHGHV